MSMWQYKPVGQLKSKATYICIASPSESKQQPQPASTEPRAQYFITWRYPYANNAPLAVNCESRWGMLHLPYTLETL